MSNQLATYEELERMSQAFAKSGYFKDARDASQAFVKILAGREWGLGPMASMTGIFIVDGKPSMSATTIAGCIKKSGKYDYRIIEHTDTSCEIEFFQGKESLGKSRFTTEDAARAGLLTNPTYKKYPRNMYFSRALTNGARWHTAEVFGGAVYTPDEVNASIVLDEEGAPVAESIPEVKPRALGAPEPSSRKPLTNAQLSALYAEAFPDATDKLGVWIEREGIATDLKSRGRGVGLTTDEAFEVERQLRDAINATPSPVQPPSREEVEIIANIPIPPQSADLGRVDAGQQAAAEPVGISQASHMMVMAMFRGRGMDQDEQRHAFAANVLGKEKQSSKSWTKTDLNHIVQALEEMPVE